MQIYHTFSSQKIFNLFNPLWFLNRQIESTSSIVTWVNSERDDSSSNSDVMVDTWVYGNIFERGG